MRIDATPLGTLYTTRNESDICELALGPPGLRVVVDTNPNGSETQLFVEYHFDAPRGFRFLDEGDLIRYWESKVFTRGYHLFEISRGGWLEQEAQLSGMLNVTGAVGTYKEWFICTTNGCINILSASPPLVREF